MAPGYPGVPGVPCGKEKKRKEKKDGAINHKLGESFHHHADSVTGRHLPARPSVLRGRATPAHPSAPAE